MRKRMPMNARNTLVAVVLLVGALFPVHLFAEAREKPPKGMGKYFMLLHETGVDSLNKHQKRPPKHIVPPDVAGLGGVVLSRDGNSILIYLPPGKAKQLRNDENVAYLQRVWMGESLDEWKDEEPSSSVRRDIAADMVTNLEWKADPFLYDGSGNIKKIGTSGGGEDLYSYDAAGRVSRAVVNGSTETYRYDSFGNLLEKAITGKPPVVIPVDPGSNRILNETYDAAGNVTTNRQSTNASAQYNYDSVGMLVEAKSVTHVVRMLYTADDERIGFMMGSSGYVDSARWTIRDFNGQVLREFYGLNTWSWQEDYVYADGRLVAGERDPYYGGRRHFHTDHLGSVRLTSLDDRSELGRHDYFPFGNEQTSMTQESVNFDQRPEPAKFAGHQRHYLSYWNIENTDTLDYMHARFYNPTLGRFLSVDPAMDLEEIMHEPQLWNRYSYVGNNPMKFTDPDGKERLQPYHFNRKGIPYQGFKKEAAIVATAAAPFALPIAASSAGGYLAANPQVLLMLMGMGMGMTGGPTPMRIGSDLGAMEQRLGNIFSQELDNPTVIAAARESLGQVVATKASGAAFDHVTKFNQAVSGAKGTLDGLKKLAGDARLTDAQRSQVMGMLSKYSKKLDDVQKYFANLVKSAQ